MKRVASDIPLCRTISYNIGDNNNFKLLFWTPFASTPCVSVCFPSAPLSSHVYAWVWLQFPAQLKPPPPGQLHTALDHSYVLQPKRPGFPARHCKFVVSTCSFWLNLCPVSMWGDSQCVICSFFLSPCASGSSPHQLQSVYTCQTIHLATFRSWLPQLLPVFFSLCLCISIPQHLGSCRSQFLWAVSKH